MRAVDRFRTYADAPFSECVARRKKKPPEGGLMIRVGKTLSA